jgi:hypothetical protein
VDDLARRIRTAAAATAELRAPLEAAEPWPLSDRWGTEPEANWGPREVLAHVDEMLPYWTGQLRSVLAGGESTAVPFGRVASDPSRLTRIDDARRLTAGRLIDDIERGAGEAAAFVEGLSAEDAERRGLHPTRGELTVRDSVERFLVTHFEEHVEQLRGILARDTA